MKINESISIGVNQESMSSLRRTKIWKSVTLTFNETDDDVFQRIIQLNPDHDPPSVIFQHIKLEDEPSRTEEEYAL